MLEFLIDNIFAMFGGRVLSFCTFFFWPLRWLFFDIRILIGIVKLFMYNSPFRCDIYECIVSGEFQACSLWVK